MSIAPDERIAQEILEEKERIQRAVKSLGAAIHAAHATASPALAASVQAQQNLYDQIENEFGLLTSSEAGKRMGSRSTATRNLALAALGEDRLIGLYRGRYRLFPGFQFADTGPRPVIADLIRLGRRHGRTEAGLVEWLMAPTTYLAGERPVDVINEPKRLLAAADAAFGVEW